MRSTLSGLEGRQPSDGHGVEPHDLSGSFSFFRMSRRWPFALPERIPIVFAWIVRIKASARFP